MLLRYFKLLLISFIFCPTPVYASKDIEKTGDVLQILIPVSAYTTTLYLNDKQGQIQFYKSFATNLIITYSLKNIVSKKRPNGGINSYPSGHTSAAFQGAAFIHARYGFLYSVPAYLGATYVGYSRVESKSHFNNDVLAGATIGILSSFYFTKRVKNINISPQITATSIVLQIRTSL